MSEDNITIRKRFLSSIKRGTGEAYLLMKANPNINFSKIIIKGATSDYAFDTQVEPSRANYIYRLIAKSKQKKEIIKAVLNDLEHRKTGSELYQMCDLAVLFYKYGCPEAKEVLYNRFKKSGFNDYEFYGDTQVIAIGGLEGILKVAEVVGELMNHNKDWYEDSWRVDYFQKKNKSLDVYVELEKASKNNKYIAQYLEMILRNKWKTQRIRKMKKLTYEIVKERIDSKRRVSSFYRANELSEKEVKKLANEFLTEPDKEKQYLYLKFFNKRKFPFGYKQLLKIVRGKNSNKDWLVRRALEALQFFRSRELRMFALDKIKTAKEPYYYLYLLVSNYKRGDYKLLNEVINRSNEYEYIHELVFEIIDIYETNPTPECKGPLENIYNKMNCGLHRSQIIELLIKNNVLSDRILQEMEFDSNDGVRRLFRQIKNTLKK
jgi:hypothetical protein